MSKKNNETSSPLSSNASEGFTKRMNNSLEKVYLKKTKQNNTTGKNSPSPKLNLKVVCTECPWSNKIPKSELHRIDEYKCFLCGSDMELKKSDKTIATKKK